MGDLISRQAAIEAMCELMHHWFGEDIKDEAREISRELGKLPSAQPEPKWIPVEYRPPEFGKEVLISHKGVVSIDWLTQSEGWAYFFVSGAAIADIDAWMQLPEPYRKGAEDGS